jgi:hypothetical protein
MTAVGLVVVVGFLLLFPRDRPGIVPAGAEP